MPDSALLIEVSAPWAPATESRAADHVRTWWQRAQHVYPANTLRAWRFDWSVYLRFCFENSVSPLPAEASSVAAFVSSCRAGGKKPATVSRYLATIALAHRVAKLENPVADEAVKLELKGFRAAVSVRQKQAHPFGWADINRYLEIAGASLRETRDCALLCVAYDTMARRSELVALNLEDIERLPDGTGRALIRRSKTDQAGEGHQAYLSRQTVRLLLRWTDTARIKEGSLFRRLLGASRVGERLNVDSVAEAYKRAATAVGMPDAQVAAVSGHSIRVGAAQDLLALNIDLASVMQAGRWKSARMPLRYGEHVLAARGGMARAAAAQGRDEE
ncbi:MAG: tyrosine-type recombinase/integrase [Cyanobacteria bacterium SZAS LIN-2]|nr:tyrosine-type recombinase/integrase [Cyanobacteria bacterium SZAS LIN-2]